MSTVTPRPSTSSVTRISWCAPARVTHRPWSRARSPATRDSPAVRGAATLPDIPDDSKATVNHRLRIAITFPDPVEKFDRAVDPQSDRLPAFVPSIYLHRHDYNPRLNIFSISTG